MEDCIFCKIINKEVSSEIAYEDEKVIVFEDIEPKFPVHFLIVPKKHISFITEALAEVKKKEPSSTNHLGPEDKELIGELFLVAQKIAKEKNVAETGYRLIFNIGKDAGQTVHHLHLHLMGGRKLPFA